MARPAALLLGLTLLAGCSSPGVEFPLVRDGEPVAHVLVAGEDKNLRKAADDFVAYVEKISGAKLRLTAGERDLPGPTLHVGETELFAAVGALRGKIRCDGFILARLGEDLLVAGNLPKGTENGLWTLLQDHFGVRWYFAGDLWEKVPAQKTLSVFFKPTAGENALVENPSFYGRRTWGDPPSKPFARRLRLNYGDAPVPYVGSGHSLGHVVPLDRYAKDHPEYFAFQNGRRVTDRESHPCLTHPDMPEVFMRYVREGGTSFGVNDNLDCCYCPTCKKVDGDTKRYLGLPSFSESYFRVIRRVAEQTAVEFPGKRIGMFAYQQSVLPPKTVDHVGENVDILLCLDTSQEFDAETAAWDREIAATWTRKAGGVSFYDYIGLSNWMPRYFPNVLANQLKHFEKVGGLGYQTHSVTMVDSAMPMFYVLYRMLWDTALDPDDLVEEMIADLYGEAAGPIRDYYKHWQRIWHRRRPPRWLHGIDDLRGEMSIYTPEDLEEGKKLLDKAAGLARNAKVKKRTDFLQESFGFSLAAGRAHHLSMAALEGPPPATKEEAVEQSDEVAATWKAYLDAYESAKKVPWTTPSGWCPKTYRVRAWALKQQIRDAVVAPLVQWVVDNERKLPGAELRAAERELAEHAAARLAEIEALGREHVSALQRVRRADPLRVADVPRVEEIDWTKVPEVKAVPWLFRLTPVDQKIGRYDEPKLENVVQAPDPKDQSVTWQCAWDEKALHVRVNVTDDRHNQSHPAPAMWKADSLQIALDPNRGLAVGLEKNSWDYLMGGHAKEGVEFGVSLNGEKTETHIWKVPDSLAGRNLRHMTRASATREENRTIYEVAIDWRLLPDFPVEPERSLGISLVVNDVDDFNRRTAEYGGGVVVWKRPGEFAAVRLTR